MDIQELIEAVPIDEYIGQFVDWDHEENGELWCLSPFTNEKTASFSVSKDMNMWYCFSSGSGGNIISFIMKLNRCGYSRAVEILKKYANIDASIDSPKRLTSSGVIKKYREPKRIIKKQAGVYLDDDVMSLYDFDESKLSVWVADGISYLTMKKFQVRYDSVANRIVFPIKDMDGAIINICGRTIDPDFKKKKLRKYTYYYPLGSLNTIYGFSDNMEEILKSKEIILFEGSKSVMVADGWGIKNTGAILTSHLNYLQMKLLIQLGVRVVFALDEEIDVRRDENIKKLKRFVKVEFVKNIDGMLSEKMAPVDAGQNIWKTLYEKREVIN